MRGDEDIIYMGRLSRAHQSCGAGKLPSAGWSRLDWCVSNYAWKVFSSRGWNQELPRRTQRAMNDLQVLADPLNGFLDWILVFPNGGPACVNRIPHGLNFSYLCLLFPSAQSPPAHRTFKVNRIFGSFFFPNSVDMIKHLLPSVLPFPFSDVLFCMSNEWTLKGPLHAIIQTKTQWKNLLLLEAPWNASH